MDKKIITERETDPFDLDWSEIANDKNKNAGNALIRVADVEYEDDDGEDCHVLIKVKEDDTEDSIEEALSEQGMIFIYVNEIFDKVVENGRYDDYNDYDVIEVLD